MKETPGDHQAQRLGFATAGGHLDHQAQPGFIEEIGGDFATGIEAQQVEFVGDAGYLQQVDDGFDRFTLGEEIAELFEVAVGIGQEMGFEKPPVQQRLAGGAGAGVAGLAKALHVLAQLGYEGGKQEIVAAAIGPAWIGKPALGWIENQMRIAGKAGGQGHGGIRSPDRGWSWCRCRRCPPLSRRFFFDRWGVDGARW